MALKVIGAGFGRTGTMSLKVALEKLGFSRCYHMVECFPKGPKHWNLWTEAVNGRADWDSIFDGFEATVDFPACTSYRALAEFYPDAKVLLSVRSPETWYTSTQETIFAEPWLDWLQTQLPICLAPLTTISIIACTIANISSLDSINILMMSWQP